MIVFDEESGKVFDVPDDVVTKYEMEPAQVQELMAAMKAGDCPVEEANDGDVKGYWSSCWNRKKGNFSYGNRSYSSGKRSYCVGGSKNGISWWSK